MRKLWLENENGFKYSFNDVEVCLADSLINFGIEVSNTYFEYENSFATASSKMTMMKPSMNLNFIKGYQGYQDFINFAYKAKELKLYYETTDIKYCYVDIERLSKSELTSKHSLRCQIVFNRKSMWMKEYAVVIDTQTSGAKAYDYTYDYRYIEVINGEILVTNNGSIPAPMNVTIRGAVSNPSVRVLVEDEIESQLILNITSDTQDAELVIISEEGKEEMILIEDERAINVYQYQDFTKNGFLFIPVGESKVIVDPGSAAGTHRITVTFHELYRGN